MDLKGRDFLKMLDFSPEEIQGLIDLSLELKAQKKAGQRQDEELRGAKSARFLDGINKFSIFLVDAARAASPAVQFENEFAGRKKKTVRRAKK